MFKCIIKLILIYFFFIKVYSDFVGVVIRGVMVVIDGNVMVINLGEDVKWVCIYKKSDIEILIWLVILLKFLKFKGYIRRYNY